MTRSPHSCLDLLTVSVKTRFFGHCLAYSDVAVFVMTWFNVQLEQGSRAVWVVTIAEFRICSESPSTLRTPSRLTPATIRTSTPSVPAVGPRAAPAWATLPLLTAMASTRCEPTSRRLSASIFRLLFPAKDRKDRNLLFLCYL